MVQRNDRYNEQNEDDEGNEYVDQFIDTGAAVERYVLVCSFFLELGSAEIFLSLNVSHAVYGCSSRSVDVLEAVAFWS
jgi:hypothetical protein